MSNISSTVEGNCLDLSFQVNNSNIISPVIESTISFETSRGLVTYDIDDLVRKLELLDIIIEKFLPEELL